MPVHTAPGHFQKKGVSPGSPVCHMQSDCKLKYVKGVSCVTHLCCANLVTNVKPAAPNLPVGARLQNFWQTWLDLGAGPKVVQILKEGYTLPFRTRPSLTRSPTVLSCYVNPHRNSYLLEALHQLINKNAIELVHNQTSLGFFNRLFLVPKPNNKWRPILDLSKLNLFLKTEKFKMETLETIRTSLQRGEWVSAIDFKDAYFHIPIQEQSRKYLRFHVQGQTYQFKALPFGLSTAPLEFTVIAKEVKLMATQKGIRVHQYLELEGSGITGKDDSHSQVLAPTLTMVARRRQCFHRSTITPNKTCAVNLYRHIKRRVGRSLKRAYCKRNLVPTRKQAAYKLPRTQSGFLSPKGVQRPLHKQASSCRSRQYHGGGRHEIGPALRTSLEEAFYLQDSVPLSPWVR